MPLVDISEETLSKIKEQFPEVKTKELNALDDLVGEKWFFRTVTQFMVGRVVKRLGNFLVMENASWVADTGRLMNAIKDGSLEEVEPVGDAILNLDSVVDGFPWKHELPTEQK